METELDTLRRQYEAVIEQRNNLMIELGLLKLKAGKFWKPGKAMTKTKIGNYFNRYYPERSASAKYNFTLGVRFAEEVHGLSSDEAHPSNAI